jgi:His/Glu/Gln/Arg/opine family amino acid ABC transporter permease subunit
MEIFNPEIAVANIGPLLAGLLMTIELTLVVIVLSLVFALFVALAGMSRVTALRWLVISYIEVIRGTPLLLQLVYVYYVLPEIGIRLNSFVAGVIALTLNYSAYISEVYRGGIEAIGSGQHDAAAALGMGRWTAMRLIILPQAIRIVVPTLGNYFISLFKDTALCSVVSIQEVVFTAQILASRNFQYFTLYTVVGVMYFVVSFPAARLVGYLERLTKRDLRARITPFPGSPDKARGTS